VTISSDPDAVIAAIRATRLAHAAREAPAVRVFPRLPDGSRDLAVARYYA
jgi:hypothetical protein